jgi:hypothetical protein
VAGVGVAREFISRDFSTCFEISLRAAGRYFQQVDVTIESWSEHRSVIIQIEINRTFKPTCYENIARVIDCYSLSRIFPSTPPDFGPFIISGRIQPAP